MQEPTAASQVGDLYAELRRRYRLFGNVNLFAFDTNADAVATAVATFAYDTSALPPRPATTAGATARATAAGGTAAAAGGAATH